MSLLLDLIFPRPYNSSDYYHSVTLNSVKHFPRSSLSDSLSVFRYTGIIRQTLIDIKYNFVSDACHSLGSFTSQQLLKSFPNIVHYWQKHQFSLVPIPLHSHRLNWRGFNQAEILGQLIANQLGLSYSPLLTRGRYTPPQVSLHDKSLRSRNLKNVFSTINDPPSTILLFDDVATTYSTLRSAATVLSRSGATNIFGLTIAG